MIKSFLSSILVLLCVTVFEAAVLSNIYFLPAIPDLALVCVLFFSVNNGRILGETTGFVSGLLIDFLSAAPLGLNCLLRCMLGFIGGIFNKEINTEGFFIPFFLGFCATLIKAVFLIFISLLFPSVEIHYRIISLKFAFELGANSLLTPFVFKFLRNFKNSIVMKPENIF